MNIATQDKLRYADGEDEMRDWEVRPGLTWRQKRDAEVLRSMSRGTMLVYGDWGSGKDLFGNSVAYMNKYYFNRPVLLDTPPRNSFGLYTPFDAGAMMAEIRKMAKKAGVVGIEETKDEKEYDEFITEATRKWALEGEGYVLLKNAVVYLSELRRYCYKRNSGNKFNKFIGSLNTQVRHLDMLIIGTHIHPNEIDEYTFMQYANIRAKCEWSTTEPDTTKVKVAMRGIIGADFAYGQNIMLKPFYYYVNGRESHEFIGFDADPSNGPVGNRFYDLWKSKNFVNLIPVPPKEV